MITFIFTWMGGLIFWALYLVINTITWAMVMEKRFSIVSGIANDTIDTGGWYMATMTWVFWPIIMCGIILVYGYKFIFSFLACKLIQKIAQGLLKCMPKAINPGLHRAPEVRE